MVVELRESKGSSCTLASVQSQLSSTTCYYCLYNLQFTCLCHIVNCPNPNPSEYLFIYTHTNHFNSASSIYALSFNSYNMGYRINPGTLTLSITVTYNPCRNLDELTMQKVICSHFADRADSFPFFDLSFA